MSGRLWLLSGLIIAATRAAHAQPAPPAPEANVREVVERYLHGLKFNDTLSLKSAFWPEARLFFVQRNGTLGQLTQAEWYKGFAGSAGKEESGTLTIAALDISDNIASVKVVETYPTSVYTDYLNLVRWGNEWRIVNKVYTSHPR